MGQAIAQMPTCKYSTLTGLVSGHREKAEQVGTADGREVPDVPHVEQTASEMDPFSRRVLDDEQPLTGGEEGLRDTLAIEALYETAETGRTVKVKPV